jgi:Uncharacterized conserved protein (DUF2190)
MAYEETLKSFTLNADSSIGIYTGVPGVPGSTQPNNGHQYKFIKITGAHQCGLLAAVTEKAVGVLQNKPQGVGHAATVGFFGISKVRAAKAIAAGAPVYSTAAGLATDASAGGALQQGIAILAAGAADDLLPVLLV